MYHHWGSSSIYWPLSYPFLSLVAGVCELEILTIHLSLLLNSRLLPLNRGKINKQCRSQSVKINLVCTAHTLSPLLNQEGQKLTHKVLPSFISHRKKNGQVSQTDDK